MSKQDSNQIPKFPLNVTVCVGPEVYGGRRWEGADKAAEDIAVLYKIWRGRRPIEEEHAWFCPICTAVVHYAGREGAPECPRHGVGMRRYSEEEFSRRREEIAEAALRDIPGVVHAFAKAAEMYGEPPVEWRFENGVVTVKLDSAEFRYEDGAVRAVFYRCDAESCHEAAKFLRDEAVRLGLKIAEEFYQQRPPFPAYYDRSRDVYVYKL
jgi:hypothetical protein